MSRRAARAELGWHFCAMHDGHPVLRDGSSLGDRMEELLRSLRPRAAPFKIHLGAARVESIAGALRNGDELVPPALESARPGRSAPEEDPVVEQPSGE